MSKYWPVILREQIPAGVVRLRPITRQDEVAWTKLRQINYNWLQPWEATTPASSSLPKAGRRRLSFKEFVKILDSQGNSGTSLPWGIEFNGQLVGQITVASMTYGSLCSAVIGYWISRSAAGNGIMPTAVAMATDYCFFARLLHRVEINIRPENSPSLRVVEKLGFRDEGIRKNFLHINGNWSDHRTFALTVEEVPQGLLTRWRTSYPAMLPSNKNL